MEIFELLHFAVDQQASDLHLSAGLPPLLRIQGKLVTTHYPMLDHNTISLLLAKILPERCKGANTYHQEIDFAFQHQTLARFRVNIYTHSRGLGAAFRILPLRIPTLENLNLPYSITQIAALSQGLILVTGPAGAGKSSTLAAIIDYINSNKACHILTLEDPIEFVHQSRHCLINQREIAHHSKNFQSALRAALRQDPDVILIGELRDLETIRLALTAAETGHLVLASLHTNSAISTVNRIIDVFPSGERNLICTLLADSLQAVIAQRLLNGKQGKRLAAIEIMMNTPAIRHLIREHKPAQMYTHMQTGKAVGMQTFEQHVKQLLTQGFISAQSAEPFIESAI